MRPAAQTAPVKLVVSVFTAESALFSAVIGELARRYGQPDFLSETLDFGSTDYYREEMGFPLSRKLVSFESLIRPDGLSGVKLYTNGIEDVFLSADGKRRVNIDPGVLTLERFVLASCKNFTHRIYIGGGVYADLTLIYSATSGSFRALEWTYPDYAAPGMTGILKELRRRYALSLGMGARKAGKGAKA